MTRLQGGMDRPSGRSGPAGPGRNQDDYTVTGTPDGVLAQISARSPLAEALRYAVKLKPQLRAHSEDGRLEIDNNLAENALRGLAVGRKNWLFAGADCGGERAAAIYSLLETAKLNGVSPQAWLADVLDRIGNGHPINRVDELLPWNLCH